MTAKADVEEIDQVEDPVQQIGPEVARTLRIDPTSGWASFGLGELWAFRDLLWLLVMRDINVRHRQTIIGPVWAILHPLLTMGVLVVVFGRIVGVPTGGYPYAAFALAGLLPWTYFSYALTHCGECLVVNAPMITKVYFPRLVLPLSAVIGPLFDFAVAFLLYLAMMGWFGIAPTWRLLAVPALMVAALLTALACGLWLAALHVRFRDVGYGLPFLVQTWLLMTPVAYPAGLVPARWRAIYDLNPMAGVVEGFRWAMLGMPAPDFRAFATSMAIVLTLLVGGVAFLSRTGETMVDVI